MKRNLLIGASVFAFGFCALSLQAQEGHMGKEDDKKAQTGHSEEEMQQWIEANKKKAQHEAFKDKAGTWKTKITDYHDPSNPQVSEGESKIKLILDGRYLEEHYAGTWQGEPFEGRSTLGYDNVQDKYVSTWIDSMSTGIMMMEGTADKDGKIKTFMGEMPTPDGNMMKMKMIVREVDKDKFVSEFYMVMGDQEMKTMEIVYTRA